MPRMFVSRPGHLHGAVRPLRQCSVAGLDYPVVGPAYPEADSL